MKGRGGGVRVPSARVAAMALAALDLACLECSPQYRRAALHRKPPVFLRSTIGTQASRCRLVLRSTRPVALPANVSNQGCPAVGVPFFAIHEARMV